MIYVWKVTAYESIEAYEANATPEGHVEAGYEDEGRLCIAMHDFAAQARREGVLSLLKRLFRSVEKSSELK